jgi:hypothetical protein
MKQPYIGHRPLLRSKKKFKKVLFASMYSGLTIKLYVKWIKLHVCRKNMFCILEKNTSELPVSMTFDCIYS